LANTAESTGIPQIRLTPRALLGRLAIAAAVLGAMSLGVAAGARWLGSAIATGGHTESLLEREIVIGNDVFRVPENAIRFGEMRRDGVLSRLDLYLHWPDLAGYSHAGREAFNHVDGSKDIVFMAIEPRMLSRDMSGRLNPIYRHLIEAEGAKGPGGLALHRFRKESGYVGEVLAIGGRAGEPPFVARCLSGDMAAKSLAPCERDVLLTDETSVSYRFPEELLADWRRLDSAVMAKAKLFLQASR
jgi:hypothetical protein